MFRAVVDVLSIFFYTCIVSLLIIFFNLYITIFISRILSETFVGNMEFRKIQGKTVKKTTKKQKKKKKRKEKKRKEKV